MEPLSKRDKKRHSFCYLKIKRPFLKLLSFFILCFLPLSLWGELSLKDAKALIIDNSYRGFSLINDHDKVYTFSYSALQKKDSDPTLDAIRYFKQLQLNDNKTLSMKVMGKNKKVFEKELHFFMGTQDIKAKIVNDNYIFLTARTARGELKIALLDQTYNIRFTQSIKNYSIKKIYNIFSHLDGSYSLALKVSNHKNSLSYFKRGTGKNNIAILKFSPLLHLIQTHFIGDTYITNTFKILKDKEDIYYIFNQNKKDKLTLYKHDFHKNDNEKFEFTLQSPYRFNTASSRDFSNFYLGADKNSWMTLNIESKNLDVFELAKVKHGSIKSISILPNNSILVSGKHRSSSGESDIFIHNYSPYKSFLWGHTFHSDFNDQVINHKYKHQNIFLTTLVTDKKNQTQLAFFKLNFSGKVYK